MTTESNSILSNAPLNLAAGQQLAGCYLLDRPLETGGGHLIWLAQDEVLGKKVSLHFLPASVTKDAAALESLRHEVKRGRPLIYPGVLRVYDLVEGDDWTAVAMDAFEGQCLTSVLEEKGRFEVEEVDAWLDQVCVTLEEAQRIKLTHRDLAPDNIFVTPAGRLLLANFGLSRVVQDSMAKSGAGTARVHTLSPQLLAGEAPAPTDDVYGVGTLFYELIAGQPVFSGGDMADKIRQAIPPRLSEVRDAARDPGASIPPGWENVIAACLNKEPDERPQRPSEIVSGIEAYAPVSAPASLSLAGAAAVSEEALTEVEPAPLRLQQDEPAPLRLAQDEPVSMQLHSEPPVVEASLPVSEVEQNEEIVEVREEPVTPPVEIVEAIAEVEAAASQPAEPEAAVLMDEAVTSSPQSQSQPESEVVPPKAEPPPEKPMERKVEPKPAPHRPVQMYDTDEDAFSSILPKRFRFPLGVAAAVVVLLLLLNGFFNGSKETPNQPPTIATTDSSDRTELTSVKNSTTSSKEPVNAEPRSEAAPVEPVAPVAPEPVATQKPPVREEIALAAGPKSATPAPTAPAPSVSNLPPDKEVAMKAAAVERLKEELAASEKAIQARAKEQQTATAALAATQKTIDEKTKAAQTAKKVSDELLAARKKREDDQKETEAAARAAQQLAAEKVRASEEAKKALADFEAQNRDKLAAQDKADAEIKALRETLAGQQKTAEEGARTAATAEIARQQQMTALQQTEQELAQAKANSSKASVEEERRRQAALAERQKLDDELASMRALFEQKMKDIEDRRRQIDNSAKPAATPTTSIPVPPVPMATPVPAAVAKAPAPATPAPALPQMAMKTEPPAPSVPAPIPVPIPQPAVPAPVAPSPGSNSLGMKFVPVGDVSFSVWQTRVKDFEAFAKSVNLKSTAWRNPGFRQGPDHPAVNVTWTEAIAFCKWLSDKEHKEGTLPANQFYRLPYDLEWSKGAALPDETGKTPEARDMGVPDVYPWGTDWPPPKGAGNYTGEETGSDVAIKGYDDGFAWTAPVGSFPPNKLGLYDMGGNVWQWCMDSWNNESKAKVLRGASWYNGALKLSLLASCRIHAAADSSTDNYGFRIVRATETPAGKAPRK